MESKSSSGPVEFVKMPTRAGLRARELEAAVVVRMLKYNVISPLKSMWASPRRSCSEIRRFDAVLRQLTPTERCYEKGPVSCTKNR